MDAKAKVVAKQIRWQDRDCDWERWLDMGDYDPNGYSGNIPYETRELIPLTDHEAALAKQASEISKLKDESLVDVTGKLKAELAQRKAERQLQTLITGMEALAGEWAVRGNHSHPFADDYEAGQMYGFKAASNELRTLASSATGEKNTEEVVS